MSPRVPPGYEDLRRQEILEAAWHLFGEKGFHLATLRDLAGRMGVSTGVIYTYFASKDEIFIALQERSRQRNDLFLEELLAEGSLRAALERLLTECARCFAQEQGRRDARSSIGLLADAMRRPATRAQATSLYEHFVTGLEKLCREGRRRGELSRDTDPHAYARYLMALFLGLQIQGGLLDRDPAPPPEMLEQFLLRGTGAAATARRRSRKAG